MNWIEKAMGKHMLFQPICIGYIHGRKAYSIEWSDATESIYYIDFERKEIEEC